ncbi:hypothetical protein BN903_41 [Halorubrum sp. AJ67]|nr:hypothetical protein BN903_41 [Halorubrum sp. AJ67]
MFNSGESTPSNDPVAAAVRIGSRYRSGVSESRSSRSVTLGGRLRDGARILAGFDRRRLVGDIRAAGRRLKGEAERDADEKQAHDRGGSGGGEGGGHERSIRKFQLKVFRSGAPRPRLRERATRDRKSGFEAGSCPTASVVGRGARFRRRFGLLRLTRRLVDRVDVGDLVVAFVRLIGPVTRLDFRPRARLVVMMAHDNY